MENETKELQCDECGFTVSIPTIEQQFNQAVEGLSRKIAYKHFSTKMYLKTNNSGTMGEMEAFSKDNWKEYTGAAVYILNEFMKHMADYSRCNLFTDKQLVSSQRHHTELLVKTRDDLQ